MGVFDEVETYEVEDGRHFRTTVPRGAYAITVEAIVPPGASAALCDNAEAVVRIVGATARRLSGAGIPVERAPGPAPAPVRRFVDPDPGDTA